MTGWSARAPIHSCPTGRGGVCAPTRLAGPSLPKLLKSTCCLQPAHSTHHSFIHSLSPLTHAISSLQEPSAGPKMEQHGQPWRWSPGPRGRAPRHRGGGGCLAPLGLDWGGQPGGGAIGAQRPGPGGHLWSREGRRKTLDLPDPSRAVRHQSWNRKVLSSDPEGQASATGPWEPGRLVNVSPGWVTH